MGSASLAELLTSFIVHNRCEGDGPLRRFSFCRFPLPNPNPNP